jgi:hypothetical protein
MSFAAKSFFKTDAFRQLVASAPIISAREFLKLPAETRPLFLGTRIKNPGQHNRAIRMTEAHVLKTLPADATVADAAEALKIATEINAAFPDNPPIVPHIAFFKTSPRTQNGAFATLTSETTHPLDDGLHIVMEKGKGLTLEEHMANGMTIDVRNAIRDEKLTPLIQKIKEKTGYSYTDTFDANVLYDPTNDRIQLIDMDRTRIRKTGSSK